MAKIDPKLVPFINRIVQSISRIQYKPGWVFRLGYDLSSARPGDVRSWIQVEFPAPDCHDGQTKQQRGRKWRLSQYMTVSEIVRTAFAAILVAEEHEAREFFRYRGERIFGPHIDVDSLHAIAKQIDARPEPPKGAR